MDSFIIELGSAFKTAVGISSEATSTLLLFGLIWFYASKWKPFSDSLNEHLNSENEANASYILRASDRDKLSEEMKDSIMKLDDVISGLSGALDKSQSDRDLMMRDGHETRTIVSGIREDIIRINMRLEMSPNARALS